MNKGDVVTWLGRTLYEVVIVGKDPTKVIIESHGRRDIMRVDELTLVCAAADRRDSPVEAK